MNETTRYIISFQTVFPIEQQSQITHYIKARLRTRRYHPSQRYLIKLYHYITNYNNVYVGTDLYSLYIKIFVSRHKRYKNIYLKYLTRVNILTVSNYKINLDVDII